MGGNPFSYRLVADARNATNSPEVHPIDIQLKGLMTNGVGIPFLFRLGRVAPLAVAALQLLAARWRSPAFDLSIFGLTMRTLVYFLILSCEYSFHHSQHVPPFLPIVRFGTIVSVVTHRLAISALMSSSAYMVSDFSNCPFFYSKPRNTTAPVD